MRAMVLRYAGMVQWLMFFSLILFAWAVLFAMQLSAPDADLVRLYGAEFWASICAPSQGEAGFGLVFLMWALMSAAMMAPTFVPTLKTYRDLTHTDAAGSATMAVLLLAYLAIWIGYSALAAAAQLGLARAGLLDPSGTSLSWGLSAILLGVAGLYQFSTFKEACLSQCRAPMVFFMQHWTPGVRGAFAMGMRLGLICLGCCWALMALAFVGGVMNLVWMGLATLIMVAEKLPELGRYITRPLGILLLGGSIASALMAFGI